MHRREHRFQISRKGTVIGKLVVVSNRLPPLPQEQEEDRRKQEVGGLVYALLSALDSTGGGLWFGWSGNKSEDNESPSASWKARENRIIGFDLTSQEVDFYYNGFCNRTLWPLLHSFQGEIQIDEEENQFYKKVNEKFARVLLPFLEEDDFIWVNDYHLLLMGRELKRSGFGGKIGFFLHVPFPPYGIWQILPDPEEFLDSMMDYDLVGFHTQTYRDNYVYSCQRLIRASWDGAFLRNDGREQRARIIPIGIDVKRFREAAKGSVRPKMVDDVGDEKMGDRFILFGVDRLDYTKGIPQRILAFESFLLRYPKYRGEVTFFQISAPSRSTVPEYIEQRKTVENLVGRINGEFAEYDWVPIRYLYRSYPQDQLSLFYRNADVGLVTPLRDGMNLVAKEFVAAQDPEDPGVLILSKFAGASEELTEAVLVNPYLPGNVADGIHRALSMSRDERVERNNALMEKVERHTAEWWIRTFLNELNA